jgi:predicted DNA-binding transcriptional regulator AlpA
MTTTTDPKLLTAAEAARLLGVSRGRVVALASSAADFPPERRSGSGGRAWSRAAIQAWAAAHPDAGPVFTGPEVPPLPQRPPQVAQVRDLASDETWALNHDWIGLDHLVLGLLHAKCPGAARAVLESLGVRAEPLRQAFVDSMGGPFVTKPRSVVTWPATQLVLERASLEAARLADAEVSSEHVLLALASAWDQSFATGWLARHGIEPDMVRRRTVDVTEGVALPEPPALLEPPPVPVPDLAAGLDLAPNPLGHDPRRRRPWVSMAFGVPEDRPPRVGMVRRQYFRDRDGYPVLTIDGQPVHIAVDERGMPVLDERGRQLLGPVEVPPGAQVTARHPA